MAVVSFVLNINSFGVGSPFGLGGYGLLDFDLSPLHETTEDPNLAISSAIFPYCENIEPKISTGQWNEFSPKLAADKQIY